MRRILVLVAVACASSCAYSPPGTCSADAECGAGNRCDQGVCLVGCDKDSQCNAWQQCNTTNQACELSPGKCGQNSDCESWQVCADNVCQLGKNNCDSSTGCSSWESCDTNHVCVLQPDRCNSWQDCNGLWGDCDATNHCQDTQPSANDILLFGTLDLYGSCGMDAISSLGDPAQARVGFACSAASPRLRPDGSLIYIETQSSSDGSSTVRVFVPDQIAQDDKTGEWVYPSNTWENDPIIPTPGCPKATTLLVQQGTGNVLYSCTQQSWYDSAGTLVVSGIRLLAWNSNGQFIGLQNGLYVFLDAQGNTTALSSLPSTSVLDVRAGGSGFLVAVHNNSPDRNELWGVDGQGQATRQAIYGASPTGRDPGDIVIGTLDPQGDLYVGDSDPNNASIGVEVEYPADGSAASIVYSEANAPAGSDYFNVSTLKLYNMLNETAVLVRGP